MLFDFISNSQLKQGEVTAKSYIPAGLTLDQYKKVRAQDQAKKEKSYNKAVSKAFKFTDFDEWYKKRGTDPNGSWLKAPGRGHTFAKTKYDYSGQGQPNMADMKKPEAFR